MAELGIEHKTFWLVGNDVTFEPVSGLNSSLWDGNSLKIIFSRYFVIHDSKD